MQLRLGRRYETRGMNGIVVRVAAGTPSSASTAVCLPACECGRGKPIVAAANSIVLICMATQWPTASAAWFIR